MKKGFLNAKSESKPKVTASSLNNEINVDNNASQGEESGKREAESVETATSPVKKESEIVETTTSPSRTTESSVVVNVVKPTNDKATSHATGKPATPATPTEPSTRILTPPPTPKPPSPPPKPVVNILGLESVNFSWLGLPSTSSNPSGKRKETDESNDPERDDDEGQEPAGGRVEGGEDDLPSSSYEYNLVLEEEQGKGKPVVTAGEWNDNACDGKGGYTISLSCLKPGVAYAAHVQVVCKIHGAVNGQAESFEMPPTTPEVPTRPNVSGKSKTSIKLRWTAPAGRGKPVTAYTMEMGEIGKHDAAESAESESAKLQVVYTGPENKCEVKGLRPGIMYRARIQASNSVGDSEWSEFTTVATSATVPAAPPQPYVAQLGLEWMVVAWQPPQEDGGSEIDSYTLEVHDGSEEGFLVKYNGAENKFLLSKVICGHKYGIRVKASNSIGSSTFSPVLEATGVCGPPNPPGQIMLAGPPQPYSLKITWSPPTSDNGSPVQLYQVAMRRFLDGMPVNGGFFEVVYNGPAPNCEISGLYPASLYEFGVIAMSALGSSSPSPCAALSTAGAPPNPPPPPFLMASEEGKLHVGWTLPDLCNGAPVVSFRLESIRPDNSTVTLYEGSSISKWLEGLAPGITIAVRVAAINAHGTGLPSHPACFTTPCIAPGAPQAVAAAGAGKNVAHVWWEVPHSDGGSPILNYRVQLSRKEGSGQDTIVSVVEKAPAVFEHLPLGTSYKVVVLAANAIGCSPWSAPTTLQTEAAPPGAPEPPVLGEVTSDTVALSWTAPACHVAAPVESFTLQMNDGGPFMTIYTGSLLSFQASGLTPGSTYKFRIRAANCKGEGPYSTLTAATTSSVVPGPPLAVTLTSVNGSAFKLKWAPPAFEGGSSTHAYSVMMREVGEANGDGEGAEVSKGKKRGIAQLVEVWSGPTTSCRVKASPEMVYEVVVIAHNAVGGGAGSTPLRITTPASQAAPVAPKPPSAMPAPHVVSKGTSLVASWIAPKDAVPPARLFHLEVVAVSDGRVVESYAGPATSKEVAGLSPGASYTLRVAAQNDVGQGPWSASAHASIKAAPERKIKAAPPAPTELELEKATKNSLRVRWAPGDGEGAGSSYKVEVAEGSGSFEAAYTGTDTECTIMKLKPAQRYRVRAQALNKFGASAYCEAQSFRTLAPPVVHRWHRTLGYIVLALLILAIIYWFIKEGGGVYVPRRPPPAQRR